MIILLCRTWATFCHCFVLQHGRLITWVETKNRIQIQLVICVALSLATVGFCQEEVYLQKIVHKDQITTVIKQQSWRFECLPFVRAKRSILDRNLTLSTKVTASLWVSLGNCSSVCTFGGHLRASLAGFQWSSEARFLWLVSRKRGGTILCDGKHKGGFWRVLLFLH